MVIDSYKFLVPHGCHTYFNVPSILVSHLSQSQLAHEVCLVDSELL